MNVAGPFPEQAVIRHRVKYARLPEHHHQHHCAQPRECSGVDHVAAPPHTGLPHRQRNRSANVQTASSARWRSANRTLAGTESYKQSAIPECRSACLSADSLPLAPQWKPHRIRCRRRRPRPRLLICPTSQAIQTAPVLGGIKTFQLACAIPDSSETNAPATAINTKTATSLTKTTPVLKFADSLIPIIRSTVTASIARKAIRLNWW